MPERPCAPALFNTRGQVVLYPFFYGLSRWLAHIGGAMLVLLVLLTCASIAGRELNGVLFWLIDAGWFVGAAQWLIDHGIGPIDGDFELIEAGVAFAIFAFLPLCQITGSHASVDIFTTSMSPRVNRVLRMVTEVVFAAVLVLIAVQLFAGMQSKLRTGQTTFLLQFPIWWAYALSLFGAVIAAIVGVYLALVRVAEMLKGRALIPAGSEFDH